MPRRKKEQPAPPPPPQGVTGTHIANCTFTVQSPATEPLANVEARVAAVQALAEACKMNADALGKAAEALRGSPQTNDNTCIKIGPAA
jgi:hypothetical protein